MSACSLGAGLLKYGFYLVIDNASSGQTYHDGNDSYTIWKTGIPGIGYIVNGYYESGEIAGGLEWGDLAVVNAENVLREHTIRIISWAKARATFTLVTTGEEVILPGQYNASLNGARFGLSYWHGTGKIDLETRIPLRLQFGVSAQSCSASADSYVMDMGDIAAAHFTDIGTEYAGSPLNITITCVDPNVGVEAVFSDFTDLTNTSEYLNLTQDSTARGIQVQLMHDGAPIAFDSPANVDSSLNRVLLKPATNDLTATFTLTPKYVRTGNKVTGGTANATSVVTFVYY
ncbi:fimbrial protein [Enterobacillus tribolii]|uniref:fimbrial protein n=1 Tax=Enterobacillus tribolii TaxID=1487935 RepID=UPI0013C36949|nr:fimbrial protein [Enterobacillus tribolii]